jgi:hypothetical protein
MDREYPVVLRSQKFPKTPPRGLNRPEIRFKNAKEPFKKSIYQIRPSTRISLIQSPLQCFLLSFQKLQFVAGNLIMIVDERKEVESDVTAVCTATVFPHFHLDNRPHDIHPTLCRCRIFQLSNLEWSILEPVLNLTNLDQF